MHAKPDLRVVLKWMIAGSGSVITDVSEQKYPMAEWTKWRCFPDPRNGELLTAPLGPGVYELRHAPSGEFLLVGIGGHCANRMSSLLPKPLGCGTRNNSAKREYVLSHIAEVEYRCLPCEPRDEAKATEGTLRAKNQYRFPT